MGSCCYDVWTYWWSGWRGCICMYTAASTGQGGGNELKNGLRRECYSWTRIAGLVQGWTSRGQTQSHLTTSSVSGTKLINVSPFQQAALEPSLHLWLQPIGQNGWGQMCQDDCSPKHGELPRLAHWCSTGRSASRQFYNFAKTTILQEASHMFPYSKC